MGSLYQWTRWFLSLFLCLRASFWGSRREAIKAVCHNTQALCRAHSLFGLTSSLAMSPPCPLSKPCLINWELLLRNGYVAPIVVLAHKNWVQSHPAIRQELVVNSHHLRAVMFSHMFLAGWGRQAFWELPDLEATSATESSDHSWQ